MFCLVGLPEELLSLESRSKAVVFTLRYCASSILYIAGNTLISDNNHRHDYLAISQLRLPVLFCEYEMQTFPAPSNISTVNNSYSIILLVLQIFTELVMLLNIKGSNCALNDRSNNKVKFLAKDIERRSDCADCWRDFVEIQLMGTCLSIAGKGR